MALDLDRVVGQLERVLVGDAVALAVGLGGRDVAHRLLGPALHEHHLDRLVAEHPAQHGAMAGLERRLVHVELVRVDRTLDDVLAEAVRAGDEGHVAEAGLGVEREEHAGAGEVRADHLHHADRQGDGEVVEALIDPVVDRTVGEQAREAAPAGVEQALGAPDVQVGLLLSGEARVWQVLGRRGAAHRERHILAVLLLQARVALLDLGHEIRRQAGAVHDLPGLLGALGEVVDVVGAQPFERRLQRLERAGRLERVAVGVGRDREPVRDQHALVAELPVHLAERGVLAADNRDVCDPDLVEPADVFVTRHCVLLGRFGHPL